MLPRLNDDSPPLVSHTVRDFLPITWEDNLCIECHLAVDGGEADATPIPESHRTDLRNAPGEVGDSVVGARYVCNSCHVAQTDASPPVKSTYKN